MAERLADTVVEEDGLLFACRLDGEGGAEMVDWAAVETWRTETGPLWVHLDRSAPRAQEWLRQQSGLNETTIDALLAEETRPRVFRGRKGTIAILRGVNTNPGAEPEDMVAIRIWSDGEKVITLRHRRLETPRTVLGQLIERGTGPVTAPQLYEQLISRLTDRMAAVIESFDEKLDEIEGNIDLAQASEARRALSDVRQDAVLLRRFMSPQREALGSLLAEPPAWLDEKSRTGLRETADKLVRYLEELDAARERSLVLKDDISSQLAESTNKTLYVLSIISAIFLPLGFLTGLLGINVGGMPGVENPYAFWIACAVMGLLLVAELIVFRRLKWL